MIVYFTIEQFGIFGHQSGLPFEKLYAWFAELKSFGIIEVSFVCRDWVTGGLRVAYDNDVLFVEAYMSFR